MKTFWFETLPYNTVNKWAAEFRRRRENVKDYERSWRPKEATTDENVVLVHSLIMCDRRRSLRDIARLGINFGAVQSVLTDILGMSKVSARWNQNVEKTDQKRSRLDTSKYLSCLSIKMILRNYVSCDPR